LTIIFHRLTRFAPNTYTFTKNMAEQVCVDFKKTSNLPITIFRPSIVSASEVEPLQGWCDNLNGPMSLIIVGALGLSHVTTCRGSNALDIIPVDVCVKGLVVAPFSIWKNQQKNEIPIVNAASVKFVTYDSMIMDMKSMSRKIPSVKMFGIPGYTFTTCVYYAWLIRIFRSLILL
jgi:alcohol-forming fatty acyl-CoA reductase